MKDENEETKEKRRTTRSRLAAKKKRQPLKFILRRSFLNTPVLTTFPKPSKSFIFRLAVAPPMNLCHKTR